MDNKITSILIDARRKIKAQTGKDVLLQVTEMASLETMESMCEIVCSHWGVTLGWLRRPRRDNGRPIMKKIIWMVLKSKFPKEPVINLAIIVGHQNHAGVHHGLKKAKGWIETKDELFIKYYEPVKHLIDEKQT